MSYLKNLVRRRGDGSVTNTAGGRAFPLDVWARLRRFLILGTEGGTFYATESTLTRESAGAVEQALAEDGVRAVREIVAISTEGRAPKNDPALFALAMAAAHADEATRKAALDELPQVARTGTHLFRFATFAEGFRGWGRGLRRAVGRWYTDRAPADLAYQAVKYRRREGVTHRDLLRLAHPGRAVSAGNPKLAVTDEHARLFEWIVRGGDTAGLPGVVVAFAKAQEAETPAVTATLVREHRLPREAVLPGHLDTREVWEALLEDMPMTALVRNLATMTRVGVLTPGGDATAKVVAQLADTERLRRARVHPIAVLAALRTYASGRGVRGRGQWDPVREVVDALDAAFYAAFANVEPTGRRLLIALDVSGSMGWGEIAGVPGLTPRDASAALALVTAATEDRYEIVGFTHRLEPLPIGPRQRLDDAVKRVSDLPFGATDVAQPMRYALAKEREVDAFVVLTDNETWAGKVEPDAALREYRARSGIDARLVVVGMTSTGFSVADPTDAGMLDVVGFDTATPQLISDFARGAM